jgi:cobalt/nickel transport system ATP-binding protein
MSSSIFELKDVHFSYMGRYPALCGIDMVVYEGEKRAIIGANGSGKSTLLQLLDGLIFPDKGAVTVFGSEISEKAFFDRTFSRDFRKRVGFLFQNPDIQLFCPSVKEEILFGPLQLREDKKDTERRFDQLIHVLGIEELLDRSPHQLSIGEKRKVAIASTLIIDPDVLLLDEPTAGLDPLTARHIIDLLLKANASGKTIITSTHDLHIVEEIADTVSVFSRDKQIVKSGRPLEILKDTALLQTHNLVHIHAHRHDDQTHVHPHDHPSHDHIH